MNMNSDDFSITKYLLDNGLAREVGHEIELVSSPWEFSEVAHEVFSCFYQPEAQIVLCALITLFAEQKPYELSKLQFSLTEKDDEWTIWFSWKDGSSYSSQGGMAWEMAVHTIRILLPKMAGSNVSYLAGQLIYDL
jgi:hypothetical protein